MKFQKLLLILLLLFGLKAYAQVDTSLFSFVYNNGYYTSVTNKSLYYKIASNYLSARLFSNIALDTSIWAFKMNQGKYVWVTNKIPFMGIDSGLIEIPLYLTVNPDTVNIRNTFDTSYIHLRIDSLANNALDINDYGSGYIPRSDGSEFKPADIDSLIGAKFIPLSDSVKYYTFGIQDSISYRADAEADTTVYISKYCRDIFINNQSNYNVYVGIDSTAINGSVFNIWVINTGIARIQINDGTLAKIWNGSAFEAYYTITQNLTRQVIIRNGALYPIKFTGE